MKSGLIAIFAVAGVMVWVLAAVGAVAIAQAVGDASSEVSQPAARLGPAGDDVPGVDVPGLPRYPGSVRAEFRRADWADETVTEVEYQTRADLNEVRGHYRNLFREFGWSVSHRQFTRGEWVYALSSGSREAVVEIELVGDMTEVEIELVEPLRPRGNPTRR